MIDSGSMKDTRSMVDTRAIVLAALLDQLDGDEDPLPQE